MAGLSALSALKGERGEKGLRGHKGDPGPAGKPTSIDGWLIDAPRYRAIPLMSIGAPGAPLELRELFVQFLSETE